MDTSRRAPGYDTFKLVVAIILLILFFVFLRRPAASPSTIESTASASPEAAAVIPSVTFVASSGAAIATATDAALTSTLTHPPSLIQTIGPAATDTLPSPTATNSEPPTPTPFPPPTATIPDALTDTPVPMPTETPVSESTPGATEETPSTRSACEAAASRSRLQAGMTATILRRLNFRSSPGIQDNWLRTNLAGTQVQVMGGPECVPHVSGAYLWWQIKLPDGEVGWSAEGSFRGTFYFMEPVE